MTEKRFQWYKDTVALNLKMPIMDNGKKLNIGEIFNELNKLNDENEQLKSFIDDLTTKGTGRIDLANGYSYNVSAVLSNWKSDVE